MSYLNGPRINFWGGFQTNVDTTNNEDYEKATGGPLIDVVHTTVTSSKTDEELIHELRQPTQRDGVSYYTLGGWNYYGDHGVTFHNAKVSSSGHPGKVTTDTGLAGLPVYLLGALDPITGAGPVGSAVMVDLDPTSSQTTQIFIGGLQVGASDKPALLIHGDAKCDSQFLGLRMQPGKETVDAPGSYAANGTFQVTFPIESVVSYDTSIPILNDLMNTPGIRGIVLRFSVFECMPYMSTPELQADYKNNRNSSNPSSGHVIGTIGAALDGEPDTVPPGRWLENKTLGGASGVALLDEENGMLSLDMVSLLPKAGLREDRKDFTGPIGPNVGIDDLLLSTGGLDIAHFNPLPDSYYIYGGIFDLAVNPEQTAALKSSPLTISGKKGSDAVLIEEKPLRIYGDPRNIYLNENGFSQDLTITMQVRWLGGPLLQDTRFTLTSSSPGILPNPKFLSFPETVNAHAGSTSVTFEVKDKPESRPGFEAITLGSDLHKATDTFINFRKYPVGDLPPIPKGGPDWDYVYENVLRYFYVVFPAMSMRIPLNYEGTIKATGPVILQRLSKEYRPTALYMPLTRAMSPERVAVLEAYLNG